MNINIKEEVQQGYLKCTHCGEEKVMDVSNFKKTPSKLGYSLKCRECINKHARKYFHKTKDKRKEILSEHQKKYYRENREAILEYQEEWRSENKELKTAMNKRHYETNREELLKKSIESHKVWVENNRDKVRAYWHERQAKKASLPHTLTKEEWDENLKVFDNACAYCGSQTEELHQEHVIPLIKNGGYTKENIIPSCKPCNSSKGPKDLLNWYPNQAGYTRERFERIIKHII